MNQTINKSKISIVVPVYNSAPILERLHHRIIKVFEHHKLPFEIVFVDDSSPDNSWQVLCKLRTRDKRLKIIQLSRNFGQHNALICGFLYATGNYIVTIDDDLQHPPEEIPKLISKIEQGYDVVYGQYLRKEHSRIKNLGSSFVNAMIKKVTGMQSSVTSFRILRSEIAEKVVKHKNYNAMIDVYISNVVSNRRIGYVKVVHDKRELGKSNYSIRKLISFAISLILNYSTLPLKIASSLGILFSSLSFLVAIYLLVLYFTTQTHVGGWTSLILTVIFFSGLILFVLGIIGEYISRIFISLSNKPQYEIREIK